MDYQCMKTKQKNYYTGLINHGETCYINSVIQSLYMTPELRNFMYNSNFGHLNKTIMAIRIIFFKLQTSQKPIETKNFTKCINWHLQGQQDVHEFLHFVFDALRRSVPSDYDIISYLYEGNKITCTTCFNCGQISTNEEYFTDISLTIQEYIENSFHQSVEQSLRNLETEEFLEDENQFNCTRCNNKSDASRISFMTEIPYIFLIHLNRFKIDLNNTAKKLNNKIIIEEYLSVQWYDTEEVNNCVTQQCLGNVHRILTTHELFVIIMHKGNINTGHYFCYIKDFQSQDWFCFNDSSVTMVDNETIQKICNGIIDDERLTPYLLMYREVCPDKNCLPIKINDLPVYTKEAIFTMEKLYKNNDQKSINYSTNTSTSVTNTKTDFNSVLHDTLEHLDFNNLKIIDRDNDIQNFQQTKQQSCTGIDNWKHEFIKINNKSKQFKVLDYPKLELIMESVKTKYKLHNIIEEKIIARTEKDSKDCTNESEASGNTNSTENINNFKKFGLKNNDNNVQSHKTHIDTVEVHPTILEKFKENVEDPLLNIGSQTKSIDSKSSKTSYISLPSRRGSKSSSKNQSKNKKKKDFYIQGLLAVCPFCNQTSSNLSKCLRCHLELPNNINVIETLSTWNNSIPMQNTNKTISSTSQRSVIDPDCDTILYYPFEIDSRDIIIIRKKHMECLRDREWLNDTILYFYLKYIFLELISEEDRQRSHFFNTFFYSHLRDNGYDKVKNWARNCNIFTKDFIVIPIHESSHWIVAIICFHSFLLNVQRIEENKEPCILVFDSYDLIDIEKIHDNLILYLNEELKKRNMSTIDFYNKENIKIKSMNVPQQQNGDDCGLHVLHNVESFYLNPIPNFRSIPNLNKWYKIEEIQGKRKMITQLIYTKSMLYKKTMHI